MECKASRVKLWREETREYQVKDAADKKPRKNTQIRTSKHMGQGALQQGRVQPECRGYHTANHREQASGIDATPVPVWSPDAGEQASRVISIAAQPGVGEKYCAPGREKKNHQRQEMTVQRIEV